MRRDKIFRLIVGFALCIPVPCLVATARAQTSAIPGAHREPNFDAQRELTVAESRMRRGDLEEALEANLAAAELDSLSSIVFERLGVAYLSNGKPRDAYTAFWRASLLDPASPSIYNRAGQVLLVHLGRPGGAHSSFEQAIKVGPRYAPVFYSLHIYHLTRGELERAGAYIKTAIESSQTDSEIALFYGAGQNMSLLSGDYPRAETAIRFHLDRIPSDRRSWLSRILVERILEMNQEAARSVRVLLQGNNPPPVLYSDLALIMRAQGYRDSARLFLEQAWDPENVVVEVGYNLALESLAAGDTTKALDLLATLESLHTGWYPIAVLGARIHLARGNEVMARRAIEHAYQLNPISGEVALLRGQPALGPDYEGLVAELLPKAESAMLSGDLALAGHYCLRACRPISTRSYALLYSVMTKKPTRDSYGLRVAQLEAAKEALPESESQVLAVIERELGEAHRLIGNYEDAEEHLLTALELNSDLGGAASLTTAELLTLYLETDKIAEAGDLANRIGETHDPHLLAVLSRWALANGDTQRQEMYLQQARENTYLPIDPAKS